MRLGLAATAAVLLGTTLITAQQLTVKYGEGLAHGFLVLRKLDGTAIADGDLVQSVSGTRVTSRLTFHFKDGSLHDETTVFSQRGRFRLIRDHLVQKGATFPQPLDMSIDATTGEVDVRYTDEHGTEKHESKHLDLPPDVANGLVLIILKNLNPDAPITSIPMVTATPKPLLVKLNITSAGFEPFSIGTTTRKAAHYVLKVDIPGIRGLLAPLVGKQPPDSHVWILGGAAPAFVKSELALYTGGPVWRIELVSPVWPGERTTTR